MGRLDGKVALITGTAGGQGRAAALLFASEGAQVVGCDVDPSGAAETVEMVNANGGSMVSSHPLDLSDPKQSEQWIDSAVEHYGAIDVLYNNAGSAHWKYIEDLSPGDWQFGIENMLNLVYYACHYAWRHLVVRGSAVIINTAQAGAGSRGVEYHPNMAAVAAKAAVLALTRQLAAEGARHGIRANSISPGTILVPVNEAVYADPETRQRQIESIALRRLGTPEEIARCALFLASDDAAYITGADLVVDGGISTVRTGPRVLRHV